MIDPTIVDENKHIWPPAILSVNASLPDIVSVKARPAGKFSIWTVSLGCFLCASAFLLVPLAVSKNNAGFGSDVDILNIIIWYAYFSGLACIMIGTGFGLFGWKAKTGKIGFVASLCIICLMIALVLVNHQMSKNHEWIWEVKDNDEGSCGC